ncbi:MAG: hypothetical protein AAF627_12825 [Myxococcota bacterium]
MRAWLVACLLLLALPARAQDLAEDRRTQVIEAVERGFHMQLEMGGTGVLSRGGEGVGPAFRIIAGNDVLPFLSFGVGVSMTVIGFEGRGNQAFNVGPVGRVQLGLLSTERDFLWIRADGGLVIDSSSSQESGFVSPALSYEHFTKLRHFSLGLSAGVDVYTSGDSPVALTITPLVKYSF